MCGAALWYGAATPRVVPATAPDTAFSAERAMVHVRAIASRPHPTGSEGHAAVLAYVQSSLKSLGLAPQVQEATAVGTRYPVAGHIRNVLARVPGAAAGGPAVLIVAHYDGVPAGPAAADDASGSAALLETLRALRAGPPLQHDVIALFTDSEESGLLGAAAFVREHPWAKDVAVVLNFEARGVNGPSFMFETGPGNLDVVRLLQHVPETRATSLSTTVYRQLPNDTDLSELQALGLPAMNFAFIGDVARYHTTEDDPARLSPGSLQHHGAQMLALARLLGDGALPRPKTGDAVFFFLPVTGLVAYAESWALPLAVLGLVLAGVCVGLTPGAQARFSWIALAGGTLLVAPGATLLAVAVGIVVAGGLAAFHGAIGSGAPAFSGNYLFAVGMFALASAMLAHALGRRAFGGRGHAGALLFWNAISVAVAAKLPGVSFVFTWPALAATAASLVSFGIPGPRRAWVATAVSALASALVVFLIVPQGATMVGVALGLDRLGGGLAGFVFAMAASLLAPTIAAAFGEERGVRAARDVALLGVFGVVVGMATVRTRARTPAAAELEYVVDVDSGAAWMWGIATNPGADGWLHAALDASRRGALPAPRWLARHAPTRNSVNATAIAGVGVPSASIVRKSSSDSGQRVVMRVRPPRGALSVGLQLDGAKVRAASVDGRAVRTDRYRRQRAYWGLEFIAPPDSGFLLDLTLDSLASGGVTLGLMAHAPGLPVLPGVVIRPRPTGVVTIQQGEMTAGYTRFKLP